MHKTTIFFAALALFACGEEAIPDQQRDKDEPCEAETAEAFCERLGAHCGEKEGKDRCGEVRAVACGRCFLGEACEANACVEAPDLPPLEEGGCLLVPEEGVCATYRSVNRCVEQDGGGFLVVPEICQPGEICVEDEGGAGCRQMESCEGQLTFCTSEGNLKHCSEVGWAETKCETGCQASHLGSACRAMVPGTVLHKGRVAYEHRLPNPTFTAWQAPTLRPARRITILSASKDGTLDSVLSGDDGTFEILVREVPEEGDFLYIAANGTLMGPGTTQFQVTHPDVSTGLQPVGQTGPNFAVWGWRIEDPKKKEILITEENASGAIQILMGLLQSIEKNVAHVGLGAKDLAAWFQPGVDWSCGACYSNANSQVGQIFYSAGGLSFYRSDSTILHEAGHYAFEEFGPELFEAGAHCLGFPAPPGQAFSEGHASWYSADLRRNAVNYAEGDGTFMYWDLDALRVSWESGPSAFAPPDPEGGIDQHVNESWVSAVLWKMAKIHGRSKPFHEALRAPEMRAPLSSAYTGRTWRNVDELCRPVDPTETGKQTPILADFLDALVCGGFSPSVLNETVLPSYPYDPLEPTCK